MLRHDLSGFRLARVLALTPLLLPPLLGSPTEAFRGVLDSTPLRQVTGRTNELFGYSVGEERRWVVASETFRFEPGESIGWRMRLESMGRQSAATIAHFFLEHETRLFSRRNNILNPDELDVIVTTTDLWVNERGFPLRLVYRDQRSGTIVRRGAVEVVGDGERLRVKSPLALAREYVLGVPRVETVDMARPEGVFLSPEVNPGLLALPFALAHGEWPAGAHFIFFDPAPLVDPPPTAPDRSDASVAPGASTWSMRRPPSPAELAGRSLRRTRLDIGPLQELEVGGVTTPAHRVGVSSANDAWIAPDGTVLRVDITVRRAHARIRLLRPSEY